MPKKFYVTHVLEAITALSIVLGENAKDTEIAEETEDGDEARIVLERGELEALLDEFGIIDVDDFLEEFEEVLPEKYSLNSDSNKSIWISE